MGRPRKTTEATFYDIFSDMAIADQASALRVLETIHRADVRRAAKKTTDEKAKE